MTVSHKKVVNMENSEVEVIDPLTEQEENRLEELERVVVEGMKGPFDSGFALREIHGEKYYRKTHPTFEVYVESKFGIARQTAYRLIDAANVFENVTHGLQNPPLGSDISPFLSLPSNERQIRSMAKLAGPEEQIEVWQRAVQTSPKGKPTGAHVNKLVNEKLGVTLQRTGTKITQAARELPEDFIQAFLTITEKLFAAKKDNFKGIDRKKVIEFIERLRRFIED
ncbi:hypothetical protein DSCW_08480 [Desulfosarcina widdelii]|uniref:Uncharacterized protein n=2 Tax=Desulfosarcina widdelii TaxID=947919 RepID=A0A5K7Z1Q4_9BACT|nr:hypothetical protein DSCW_08480 [Desulfosarcina widdelii]